MVALFFWCIVAVVLLQRLAEIRRAKRNCEWAFSMGAKEYGAAHYPIIVTLHILWYIGWILEATHIGPYLSPWWVLFISLFVIAEVLRYWTILTLGRHWNMRILVIPDAVRIRHGPYRLMNHPNFVAVTIELFCLPMIFGAWRTALIASTLYVILLAGVRIPTERQALRLLR